MRQRLLLIAGFLMIFSNSFAQIVGTNVFLQGNWLEVGETTNGSFGANTSPGTYHSHPTGALAIVYDYGYNGWAVGAPAYMGDYTFPGFPQEGWAIQVNGQQNQAFQAGGFPGTGSLTGSITSYTNVGGVAKSVWTGTAAGGALAISQETRVDLNSSWVIMTTTFNNTSAATLNNIYYLRTCDPDNDQSWPGGSFTTTNTVSFQNDVDHRVLVSAVGQSGAYTYMGLGTKDCRAKACFFQAFNLSPVTNLADIYNGTGTAAGYGYTGSVVDDRGYGLVYNLGNLPAGGSAIISCGYAFNSIVRFDSAFPEPLLVVNFTPIAPSGPAPAPTIDTFDGCLFPLINSLDVKILNATDKCWSWSTWTWAPSVGLASTTGVTNTIDMNAIPSVITYTITGTDSAANMFSCNHRVMYLTIKNCHSAQNNSPCEGDTLRWNMKGDSTGATYVWYGPAPSTAVFSTLQSPWKFPAALTDSGLYHVIKTQAGVHDTDSTYVVIHPKPNVTASSNSPLCSGILDTLRLSVLPGAPGETYVWTGPSAFGSVLQFPEVPGFGPANVGVYSVQATSAFGCKRTVTTSAAIVPPPPPPTISGPLTYCYGDAFVPFTVIGSNIKWYPSAASTTFTTVAPTVNTSLPGVYTFYATQTTGCESPKDSITVVVYPQIVPNFTFSYHRACNGDTVTFYNSSITATSFVWNFGDGSSTYTTTSLAATATHVYTVQNAYNVTLTGSYLTCSKSVTIPINTQHSVAAIFDAVQDTLCLTEVMNFTNSSVPTLQNVSGNGLITGYSWDMGDGSPLETSITPAPHTYAAAGIYTVSLTVTDSINCTNSTSRTVYVLQPAIHAMNDTNICLTSVPLALLNTETLDPNIDLTTYTYQWTPSTYLSSDTAHIPDFYAIGTYVYTLTATLATYNCSTSHVITIHSVLPQQLANLTADATIPVGHSIQLNADSELYYTWTPNDGSLSNNNISNPIASPLVTTTYTVYGMDMYGCRDTGFVTIHVDSSATEFIPSGFSPNGDGHNDVFRPVGIKFQKLLEFRVYNRWGQQVFFSNSAEKGWDGTFNGEPQDLGTYFYSIVVARVGYAENYVYKGEITLVR